MKKTSLFTIFCALFALTAFGQADLPDMPIIGDFDDIKGLTKVYVISNEAFARKHVIKKLNKDMYPDRFEVVDDPKDAELFMEYKLISKNNLGLFNSIRMVTGELTVFIYRDKQKIIAWSKSKESGFPSKGLTEKFLKELKKTEKK